MICRLGLACAVLLSLAGCGMDSGGSEQYPLPSGVQSVSSGSSIELTPHLRIDADRYGPVVHLDYDGNGLWPRHSSELPFKSRVQVWDSGKTFTIECLGLRRDIENQDEPVYAVRVVSKPAPAPEISANKPASGTFNLGDGHSTNPTSRRDDFSYSVVSHDPLLAVGLDDCAWATLITNFGVGKIDAADLYKIPDVPDKKPRGKEQAITKVETDVGPAHVTLTRIMPPGKATASISVSDPKSYKGTILCDICDICDISDLDTPDHYNTALGMPTYVNPNSPQPPELSAFQKADPAFVKSWELQLDPPLTIKHGLSSDGGIAESPANFHALLWKLDDRIYGYSGYSYSNTFTPAGGRVEGTLQDGKLTLLVMGELNLKLESSWVGADEISGNASVWGYMPASITKPKRYHKFKLIKKRDDAGREEDKLCAQIDMLAPNLDYWDAITCAPSETYRTSILAQTVRLMRADQIDGPDSRHAISAAASLAHTQYSAWLSSRNFWGENHPITRANKRIATELYRRVLRTNPLEYEYAMQDYIRMLTQAHDERGATAVRSALNRAKAAALD